MPAKKHKLEPEPTPEAIIREVNEAESEFRRLALVIGNWLRHMMAEEAWEKDDLSEPEVEFLDGEKRLRKALRALSKLRKKQKG
jgi:hypothetical protein